MSSIASFYSIKKEQYESLKQIDEYLWHDYLSKHAKQVSTYDWSGHVMATLLNYLDEEKDIDLLNGESDDDLEELVCFVLTHDHKSNHWEDLKAATISGDELRDYYNEFNGEDEDESGIWMREGIDCVVQSLEVITDDSVVLLLVG